MIAQTLVLAIDQGTTSTRAIAFDEKGHARAAAQRPLTQYFPAPGLVEHDPEEIWRSVLEVSRQVLRETGSEAIAAIGITNQRETTLLWERATGWPIGNAIVWQDRRTADLCARLRDGDLTSPKPRDLSSIRISPRRSLHGCWIRCLARERGRNAASFASARWTLFCCSS